MRGILGADIFAVLLLFFMASTGLLITNTSKGAVTKKTSGEEFQLPKVQLPQGEPEGVPGGKHQTIIQLSARLKDDTVEYFIDDQLTDRANLLSALKSKPFSSVKIRFDERIQYGNYVAILQLCRQAGISEIAIVYSANR